jgi:hypothetical protein
MSGSHFDEETVQAMHVELEEELQHKGVRATVTVLGFPQMWRVL